ncbi:hypothetical protein GGI35DRAFT_489667 [Trichoderma velutinum]
MSLSISLDSGPNSNLIFSVPFSNLRNSVVDLSHVATAFRHRLIDMHAFLHDHRLDIYEYPSSLSCDQYIAISYVWKGNPLVTVSSSPSYWVEELGTFTVKGAETGDPISLDVLYHVCSAALSCDYSGSHLWLDRLCIIQSSKEDKSWQIRQMYNIYRHSRICCILPGGIQRLVSLDEETAWIERVWTLQEALLPWRSIVLFLADEDRLEQLDTIRQGTSIPHCVTEVIPGLSAYGELRPLLQLAMACIAAMDDFPVSIFGRRRAPVIALYGATVLQNSHSFVEKDMKMQMIWRCALMRTSSRPVDMVFSIMGLLGVDLDPLQFHENDRLKATIALASKSLSYSSKANWLAAAYQLEPCREISSFPLFPDTSIDGQAYYHYASSTTSAAVKKLVVDVVEECCDLNCYLSGLPEATMDQDGYLNFCSRAVRLIPIDQVHTCDANRSHPDMIEVKDYIRAEDDSEWRVYHQEILAPPNTLAVFLGTQIGIGLADVLGETTESASDVDYLDWRDRWSPERLQQRRVEVALLIQEHSRGRFHRVSYFKVKLDNIFKNAAEVAVALGGWEVQSDG